MNEESEYDEFGEKVVKNKTPAKPIQVRPSPEIRKVQSKAHTDSLNTSSSKARWRFGSVGRFVTNTQYSNISCYEVKEGFGNTKSANYGKGFGSSSDRFKVPTEHVKAPSPDKYPIPS